MLTERTAQHDAEEESSERPSVRRDLHTHALSGAALSPRASLLARPEWGKALYTQDTPHKEPY